MTSQDDLSTAAAVPAAPSRRRRALIALIVGSALLHAGVLGGAAYQKAAEERAHPVVEVVSWTSTSTVNAAGETELTWTSTGGAHLARVTVAQR